MSFEIPLGSPPLDASQLIQPPPPSLSASLVPDFGGNKIFAQVGRVENFQVGKEFAIPVFTRAPVDADFTYIRDGLMVIDARGSKLWVRLGGIWIGATLA